MWWFPVGRFRLVAVVPQSRFSAMTPSEGEHSPTDTSRKHFLGFAERI
jgi:hypothetical protein